MKLSEMNQHERFMYNLMRETLDQYVGGWYNTIMDTEEGDEWYNEAFNALWGQPAAKMCEWFYNDVMNACKSGTYASHARFAGGEFLKARIARYVERERLGSENRPASKEEAESRA